MNKVILVTGCRSGFGMLTALLASRAGYIVYAGLRDLSTAHDLDRRAQGLSVTPLQLDITRGDERQAAVERILSEQGRLDGLVNNAGVALAGFLEQVEEDEMRRLFDVNVFGTWALTRQCLPHLRRSKGTLIQVSSNSGRSALPVLGAYAMSKFAVEGMGEALRHELKPFGVRVVLVEPGPYRTDIFERNRWVCRRANETDSIYAPYVRGMDRLLARFVNRSAQDPKEVAERIVALLGEARPALRHPVGSRASGGFLRAILPDWIVELAISRLMQWAYKLGSSSKG